MNKLSVNSNDKKGKFKQESLTTPKFPNILFIKSIYLIEFNKNYKHRNNKFSKGKNYNKKD